MTGESWEGMISGCQAAEGRGKAGGVQWQKGNL